MADSKYVCIYLHIHIYVCMYVCMFAYVIFVDIHINGFYCVETLKFCLCSFRHWRHLQTSHINMYVPMFVGLFLFWMLVCHILAHFLFFVFHSARKNCIESIQTVAFLHKFAQYKSLRASIFIANKYILYI